jgi:hypothetical protein
MAGADPLNGIIAGFAPITELTSRQVKWVTENRPKGAPIEHMAWAH